MSVIGLLALVPGCGAAGPKFAEETPLSSPVAPRGIVVLPMALAIPGATALETIARSHEVAALLLRRTDLPVLGPLDFTMQKSPDEAMVAATDTDLLMREDGRRVDVHDWITLHVLVTENRATNTRDIVDERQKDPKKKVFRQSGFDSRVRVEVTVRDAMRPRVLGHVVLEADDDPTNFESGGDPRPGITRLVEAAVNRLVDGGSAALAGRGQRKSRGDGLIDNLPAMLAWGAPEVPSLDSKMKDEPEMLREAKVLELWDRFAPGLGVRDMRAATKHSGVIVRVARAPLRVGDIVDQVGSESVRARYQFDRLLQGCVGACKVGVWRNDEHVDLHLQWPNAAPLVVP